MVSATVAPASAVPVIAAVCSLALTTSLPATCAMVGASGTMVSTVIARVPAGETLPARSATVAESVTAPCPRVPMSLGTRV